MDADSNPPYDIPVFQDDFQRGVDLINLPSVITQQQLKNEALYGMVAPQSNGVYVPNQSGNLTGGVYVRGNATINLDKDESIPNNSKAVFKITPQDMPMVTITIDYVNQQTTVVGNANPGTFNGIPDGNSNEGPLVYLGNGQATIRDASDNEVTVQKDTNMTISCENDIIGQSHIRYQEYTPSPLSAEGFQNMLGLVVWGGNSDVRIGTSAPDNIEIHAIIMAEQGVFSVDNYNVGSPHGTATLLGGAITSFYGPFGTFSGSTQLTGYGRNFIYDSRATTAGMHPPYYPTLGNFISYDDGGLDTRLRWQEQGG